MKQYSTFQLIALVILRVLIGWHFLYEGVVKLANPNWTASAYLKDSKWIFSDFFISLSENPEILSVIDLCNMWGLTLVGIALIGGLFTRTAIIAGISLLVLYFLASPPFIGLTYSLPSEGSYLIVNKNLIEISALAVLLLFPTGKIIGIDRLLIYFRGK